MSRKDDLKTLLPAKLLFCLLIGRAQDFFLEPFKNGGPTRTIPEHLYLADSIRYRHSPRKISSSLLKEIYIEGGLTSAQIAEQTGLSKQTILSRLRQEGVRRTVGRGRAASNFRYPCPPYGFKILEGQLVPNTKEMKIVRLIVGMRNRDQFAWKEIVTELNVRGYRSRRDLPWNRVRVNRIYRRWDGKI